MFPVVAYQPHVPHSGGGGGGGLGSSEVGTEQTRTVQYILASFPGSPTLEREQQSCAGGEGLVVFLM